MESPDLDLNKKGRGKIPLPFDHQQRYFILEQAPLSPEQDYH